MWQLLAQQWPLLLICLVVVATFGLGRLLLPDEQLPYAKRPSLVTDAERQFYQVLVGASQQRWLVFPMVRLADVIQVRPRAPKHQAWQGRIAARHLDFVLCDPHSLEAKLAIELDDATPEPLERVERDEFLASALAASHLPLLRVPIAPEYNGDDVKKALEGLLLPPPRK